jgi:hypothetical protein
MAVTLGSIAAALLGFAGVAQRGEGPGHKARTRLGPPARRACASPSQPVTLPPELCHSCVVPVVGTCKHECNVPAVKVLLLDSLRVWLRARCSSADQRPCTHRRRGGQRGPTRGLRGQVADNLVEVIALILLPVAVLMCAYALTVFVWRSRAIAKKSARPCRPLSHGAAAASIGSRCR